MNELNITIPKGSFLTYCREELKRIVKNFVKIYDEFLNGEFIPEPTNMPLKASEQTEELPKYLWI